MKILLRPRGTRWIWDVVAESGENGTIKDAVTCALLAIWIAEQNK